MNRPYRMLYPNLPDAEHLSPRLVQLATEARAISARRTDARVERERLGTEAAEEDAREADRQAAAAAIRAGKSMGEVGTPAFDDLTKQRELLDMELDAVDNALEAIETEMQAEFVTMQGDDRTAGRTALKAAEAKYRKALADLPALRTAYVQARGLHDFKLGASGLPGCGPAVWPPKNAGLPLNTLSTTGEQVHMLRPVTPEFLLAHTFATDLAKRPDR